MSRDFRFEFDATTFRVRARMACACPDPAKTIRKLEVGAHAPGREDTSCSQDRVKGPACHSAPPPSG